MKIKKSKLRFILLLYFIIILSGCENHPNDINNQLLNNKKWKLTLTSDKPDFNQNSIVKFQSDEVLEIIEPIEDTVFYKIIDGDKLYIGKEKFVNEESVLTGINSWLFKLEKRGSGYIGTVEIINKDDMEILGKSKIKIKLDKIYTPNN